MVKIAKLTFSRGNLIDTDFDVFLDIYTSLSDRPLAIEKGGLPKNPALNSALEQWQNSYRRVSTGIRRTIIPEAVYLEGQFEELRNTERVLKNCFLKWLNFENFQAINHCLYRYCKPGEEVQILLDGQDSGRKGRLQELPWHLWTSPDHRKQEIKKDEKIVVACKQQDAEIAFQPFRTQPSISNDILPKGQPQQEIKILAILGHSEGIDVKTDFGLLKALPHARVKPLVQPQRHQINDQLWEQPWDILFFAGHSDSHNDQGRLYLNDNDFLTIEQLKGGLRSAIKNGLKLAIFNSCDGLALAYQLEELNCPQIIVMKAPVPDKVAHDFLKYFLQSFSKGSSVYSATKAARARLEDNEDKFPSASWLPILFHNPAAGVPLKWPDSRVSLPGANVTESTASVIPAADSARERIRKRPPVFQWKRCLEALIVSCLVAFSIIGLRSLGALQGLELKSYDQMMRWRPDHLGVDNRVLVITIDQEDIAYQRSQGIKGEGSLSDQALLQILQKVEPYKPSVVVSDVIHDFPYLPDLSTYLEKTPNFMGLCLVKVEESNLKTINPPPGLSIEQLGFVNFPLDPDAKIRRQFLEMQSDSVCTTTSSLSYAIASYYLKQQDPNLVPEYLDNNHLRLGKVTFRKFSREAGGYALHKKEAGGFQVLINYRPKLPPSISLREFLVLGSSQLKSIASGRMILIGVDNGKSDQHRTPYDSDNLSSTAGVMVHAQMTSHLVSAALGEASTIRWWSVWAENLWLLVWGVWGALLVLIWQRNFLIQGLMVAGSSIVLSGICYFGLVNGLWIPFIPAWFILVVAALSFSMGLTIRIRRCSNLEL